MRFRLNAGPVGTSGRTNAAPTAGAPTTVP